MYRAESRCRSLLPVGDLYRGRATTNHRPIFNWWEAIITAVWSFGPQACTAEHCSGYPAHGGLFQTFPLGLASVKVKEALGGLFQVSPS